MLAGQARYSFDQTYMLLILLGALCIISIIRTLSQNAVQYYSLMHDDMMNAKVTTIIMEHALKADTEYFDNPKYYDKLNSANRDSHAVNNVVWNSISIVSSCISLIIAIIILSQISLLYGVVMLIASIPASIVAALFTKTLYNLSLEQINGLRQMGYIQGISSDRAYTQELRLFNIGERLKSRYRRIWKGLFDIRRKASRKRAIFVSILECLPELVVALISINIAFSVMADNATVGDYSLFVGLATQLWGSISMLSISAMQMYDNRMQLENFKSISDFTNRVKNNGTLVLSDVVSIVYEGVSFFYPGTNEKALDDLSVSLNKNEKTAIVGLNGSGKSTFIKLLLRFYEPNEGVIYINGVDIKEYTVESLRANFSVYFQEMRNLSFTLRNNFSYADEGISKNNVEQRAKDALNASGGADILEKCTLGLDTCITRFFSDDGIELSVGQHQKLALARALYRRHNVLIIDEPTSNLDPKAEHEVFEKLKELTDGKMTLFTSHRLTNTFMADRIIVLEKGKVIEDGTQSELLRNKYRFAELYKYQSDKFVQCDDGFE
jgi:ABC-type multidrug transport system fused ATPase/permease subunit